MSRATEGSGAAGLTDAELDRLADYLGDALEPDEAAQVTRLIAEDSRWRSAQATLMTADAAVRHALADTAGPANAMPDDIAAKLDDALRALGRTPVSLSEVSALSAMSPSSSASPSASASASASALSSVSSVSSASSVSSMSPSSSASSVSSLDAARRRRRGRLARITAVAAAVVVLGGGAGIAATLWQRHNGLTTASDSAGTGTAARPSAEAMSAQPRLPELLVSGTNYTPSTIAQMPAPAAAAGAPERPRLSSPESITKDAAGGAPQNVRAEAPAPLARLLDPTALAECLDVIRVINPGVALTVDYARFNGEPALVVFVREASRSVAVVVGPDCGRAGADQKASTPIG